MHDPIQELLRKTDEAMGMPVSAKGDLATRVRRKVRRQRYVRALAGILVLVGGGILSAVVLTKERPAVPMAVQSKPNDLRWVETDISVHEQIVALLEKHERESLPKPNPKTDEFLWEVSQESNRTGLILVRDGDRMYRESHDRQSAEASYSQVIRLFPDSPAAGIARERLRELGEKSGQSQAPSSPLAWYSGRGLG
jgi:hypothetical protein